MITITCINEKNQRFNKEFANPYLANKFINKCKYSKVITIVAVTKEN